MIVCRISSRIPAFHKLFTSLFAVNSDFTMFVVHLKSMKAIVINSFGEPDVFESGNIPAPEIKEDELLIEVASGSVNPVDWKQRRGNHKFLFGSKFPIVLGLDIAGKVISKGSKISAFVTGDLVCGVLEKFQYGGGLAEFVKGPQDNFAPLENAKGWEEYAILPLAGLTSLQALRDKGKVQKGDRILIIGAAGGVGHYAVQIALIYGAEVHAVSSERHWPFLQQFGDLRLIDYTKQNILDLNESFDIIYDGVGKYSYLKCRHLLKPGGRYINTLPRLKLLVHKVFSLFSRGKKVKGILMKQSRKDISQLITWVEEGKLKLCVDKEFSVNDMDEAHAYSEEGHTEGKILIRYNW